MSDGDRHTESAAEAAYGRLPDAVTDLFGDEATAESAYDLLTVDVPAAGFGSPRCGPPATDSGAPTSTGSAPWTNRASASGSVPMSRPWARVRCGG